MVPDADRRDRKGFLRVRRERRRKKGAGIGDHPRPSAAKPSIAFDKRIVKEHLRRSGGDRGRSCCNRRVRPSASVRAPKKSPAVVTPRAEIVRLTLDARFSRHSSRSRYRRDDTSVNTIATVLLQGPF
jgi:hypothetical protein